MSTPVKFEKSQIAPCGMNCGTCIAFLREKNRCCGCRVPYQDTSKTRVHCIVKNCTLLACTSSGFCYECEKFPCKRINQLDKRYRTKYRTSFIDNLLMIKEMGIDEFLIFESSRRTCPSCGAVVSVHRPDCLKCSYHLS
jgi:hypothetical protein